MRVLRGCKMTSISLDDKYGDKRRMLLGFLLVASCVLLMRIRDFASELMVGERLVSSPNPYFEFGIVPYEYSGNDYLPIKYALPTDPAVNGVSNHGAPLASTTVLPRVLQFHPNGTPQLSNKNQNTQREDMRYTFTDNKDVVSAKLLDTGKLALKKKNGTEVWNSFDHSPPTDTLLPGQHMLRRQGHSLKSWQKISSLDATSQPPIQLKFGDGLVSSPNHYFELGIFSYFGAYFLCIRYAPPIDQVVTWIANRNDPLTVHAVLQFVHGNLVLKDPPNNIQQHITGTGNRDDVVSAELLDTGKLVLKNQNGTEVWNSFDHSLPTDTLLPGQHMRRSEGHRLNSWQKSGNPAIANDTYAFGWDSRKVLTLSWTCSMCNLDWKGGPYIPAPDVYAAHTIQHVEDVYFHEDLGHLYIGSDPPTAILSGGLDRVNDTTLRRITMDPDGGLRIWQYKINQTVNSNQTSNRTSKQGWVAVANWVVSDRPDSRSRCTTFGTRGPFSECVSPFVPLEPVTCRCPGTDDIVSKHWLMCIDVNDTAKGCYPPSQGSDCPNLNETYTGTTYPVCTLELPGVEMPWGGDYQNLTGNASVGCKEEPVKDCRCAGAVYSKDGQACWAENGVLFNLGNLTVALHGTDRTSFLRRQTVKELSKPQATKKDNKVVKILGTAFGVAVVLLIAVVIFCLRRNEKVQHWLRACGCCGSCCSKPNPRYEIRFPGDTPVRAEPENGGVELEMEERGSTLCCTCTIQCYMPSSHSNRPRI